MKWIRRLILAVVMIAAAVAVALALRPRPVLVETATIDRGVLELSVDDLGRTRLRDRFTVSTPLAGTLGRLELRAGDAVKQGEVLARLLPTAPNLRDRRTRDELETRLALSRAALAQARAAAQRARLGEQHAQKELDDARALASKGALPTRQVELAELDRATRKKERESADFGVLAAEHEARLAAASLEPPKDRGTPEELVIASPVTGRVLRVLHPDEGVVGAGTPLVEVGDPAALEVVVDVLTTDAVGIAPGAPVRCSGWGGEQLLSAVVERIEPSATTRVSALGVEEQRVTVVVAPQEPVEVWRTLGDGWRVEASIVTARLDDVTLVPGSAVFRQGASWAVFVVEGDRARLRPIVVGRRGPRTLQVTSGLAVGERVVLHPSDRVTDGALVSAR